ncbi:MAG TPA: hypothetical protein VIL11_06130 [Limnochordales bacterium]
MRALPGRAAAVWTLFASVVGAGFATGQELVPFTVACGPASPAMAAAACVGAAVLAAGRSAYPGPWRGSSGRRPTGAREVVLAAGGRAAAMAISWISLVAMLAALAHLTARDGGQGLSLAAWGMAVAAVASLPAGRGLARLSSLLGPPMAALVALSVGAWLLGAPRPSEPAGPGQGRAHGDGAGAATAAGRVSVGLRPAACAGRAALYAAANGLFAEAALRPLWGPDGRPGGPLRAAAAVGLPAGAVLGSLAAGSVLVVRSHLPAPPTMPLVHAAGRVHPALGRLHAAAVALAAYTTAVAAVVALGQGPERAAAWTAAALPVAALGFAPAVARLYPVAGWLALGVLAAEALFAGRRRRGLY